MLKKKKSIGTDRCSYGLSPYAAVFLISEITWKKGKSEIICLYGGGYCFFGQLICIVALISLFGMIEPIAEFNPYILITK